MAPWHSLLSANGFSSHFTVGSVHPCQVCLTVRFLLKRGNDIASILHVLMFMLFDMFARICAYKIVNCEYTQCPGGSLRDVIRIWWFRWFVACRREIVSCEHATYKLWAMLNSVFAFFAQSFAVRCSACAFCTSFIFVFMSYSVLPFPNCICCSVPLLAAVCFSLLSFLVAQNPGRFFLTF